MTRTEEKNGLFIPFLQVVTDIIGIECSFLLSYWLRFYSPLTKLIPVVKGFPSFKIYFLSSWAVVFIWLIIFKMLGFYGARRNVNKIDEFYRITKGVTLGMLVVTSATFYYRDFSYSRLVFIMIWGFSILLITFFRSLLISYEKHLHRKGKGLLNAAIVGSSRWSSNIFEKVNRHPGLGLKIAGYVGENKFLSKKLTCLGNFAQIAEIARKNKIDVFFLALDEKENSQLISLLNKCTGLNIEFYLVPDLLDMVTSRLRVENLEGLPVLKIKDVAIAGWNSVFKRIFDLTISFTVLMILWPLWIIIAVAVKMDSKGSVFYKQRRVGLDGKEFNLIKFRTMFMDAEKKTGPVWAKRKDPRVTRIGRILRRTSLDELPQLINVLKGEMSLVGPRPERPHFVEQFKEKVPKYLERHRVKSGMTGWAQVNGLRGNVPIEERTKYDIYYVENWSLFFDIKIILMTIWAVIKGENSY